MKKSILIVDDISDNIDVLVAVLSDIYTLRAATSGISALDLVKQKQPDLILLDIMMPEMSGFEVCEKLKQDPDTQHIPIVFITAKSGAEDVVKGLKLGAADYITKPFNPYVLIERIRNVLDLHLHGFELNAALKSKSTEINEAQQVIRNCESILHVQPFIQKIELNIPSSTVNVQSVLDYLQQISNNFCEENDMDAMSLNIAFNEALLNALIHGNFAISSDIKQESWEQFDQRVKEREADPQYNKKKVTLTYEINSEHLKLCIKDEGEGFDQSRLSEDNDPEDLLVSGRGVLLIRSFMDDVSWNESGNSITMIKRVKE